MKILLIHNNYGIYTGEEAVVDKQIALFTEMGHTVDIYRKTTEGVRGTLFGDMKGFLQGFYSPSSVNEIKELLKWDKPDVAIVHNLYPYISPAVLKLIKEAGVPIVMTVHNFRLVCPTGLFLRDYKPCELCLEKGNEWPCIQHNCENSYIRSIGYAGRNWFARVTRAYKDHVDYFACITRFQIEKLVEAGFDKEKMVHIPNFLDNITEPEFKPGDYVAVSGRLSREKGIGLMVQVAAKTPQINYRFAGRPREEDPITVPVPSNCTFLGNLPWSELEDFYRNARFLLNASRCYEGFPITILEAASYGKPAIGPDHAGFPEIIKNDQTGLLFRPGDASHLQKKIEELWNNEEDCVKYGKNAYYQLQKEYSLASVRKSWNELLHRIRFSADTGKSYP